VQFAKHVFANQFISAFGILQEAVQLKSESYEKINYYSRNAIASQAAAIFAGEPMVSSKQVIAPPPAPPVSYFRGNELDLGAFATYVTGTNGGGSLTSRTFDGENVTLSSSGSPYGWAEKTAGYQRRIQGEVPTDVLGCPDTQTARPLCRPRLHRSRLRVAASFNPFCGRQSYAYHDTEYFCF
jgi:hypothetical protein